MRPPKLWATKMIVRLFVSPVSWYVAIAISRLVEWLPILFLETIDLKSTTEASYPNVRILACPSFGANNSFGHEAVAPSAVHVFSRCPVRPWIKMTLRNGEARENQNNYHFCYHEGEINSVKIGTFFAIGDPSSYRFAATPSPPPCVSLILAEISASSSQFQRDDAMGMII